MTSFQIPALNILVSHHPPWKLVLIKRDNCCSSIILMIPPTLTVKEMKKHNVLSSNILRSQFIGIIGNKALFLDKLVILVFLTQETAHLILIVCIPFSACDCSVASPSSDKCFVLWFLLKKYFFLEFSAVEKINFVVPLPWATLEILNITTRVEKI